MKQTLLEALCKVNGQQGGTIHQFLHGQDHTAMEKSFQHLTLCGVTFPSRKSFDKLANQYHVMIRWS